MNKVCFVVPYFGNFPSTFNYWLNCCKRNPDFTWLIYTDVVKEYDYPKNVKVIHISFEQLKKNIENKLGFKTGLNYPYKLCDFRPLYGDLFREDLEGYTHFGWCDLDIIFGRLNNFLTPTLLNKYDKISIFGHMSILKNTPSICKLYKKTDFKKILISTKTKAFDEKSQSPNINELMESNGYKVLPRFNFCDIASDMYNFHCYTYQGGRKAVLEKYSPTIFLYDSGNLYRYSLNNREIVKKEIAYVHFQKRRIEVSSQYTDKFALVPNKIISFPPEVNNKFILKNSKNNYIYNVFHVFKHVIRYIHTYF